MADTVTPHLLHNAIVSIQLGIEDYESADPRRTIGAVRNFYAGVLLLGKQCLLNQVPDADPMEVLATSYLPEPNEAGGVTIVPKGYRTIDLGELRERFKQFDLEWPKGDISGLQRLRNEFEHFHSTAQDTTIRQIIASCFPLVEGFCGILDCNPAQLLGTAWKTMLEEERFFAGQKADCYKTLAPLPWHGDLKIDVKVSCPNCGSALLYQSDASNDDPSSIEGKCRACDGDVAAERFVQIIVEAIHGDEDFLAAKDDGEPIINGCPNCGQPVYVQNGDIDVCYFCGERAASECARCGSPMSVNDVSVNSPSVCAFCYHIMSRDD